MSSVEKATSTEDSAYTRPLRVFLCHSSEDKPIVRELYRQLRSQNIDPWLDEEKLLPGQDWHLEITKAVRNSDVVVVCLSNNSVHKTGYVQREIRNALDVADAQPEGAIFIVPLRLEECNIPERLRRWQWVNYFDERGYEKLMRAIRARASELDLDLERKSVHATSHMVSCSPMSNESGGEIAVRLTPTVYPARLSKVRFYITYRAKPWTQFEVRIYADNKLGEPGSRLNQNRIHGVGRVGGEWAEVDIAQENIAIHEGDFFVSMVWLTAPGQDGKNAQSLGGKRNEIVPGRTYWKWGADGEWILEHDINCMIQVVVDSGVILDNLW